MITHGVLFSLMHVLQNERFRDDRSSLTHEQTWRDFQYILRDFKNAPFYILCLFHMINLRMFSLSLFIFLHNEP